jgi:hypothetical protein
MNHFPISFPVHDCPKPYPPYPGWGYGHGHIGTLGSPGYVLRTCRCGWFRWETR